jgi:hypothetical protein
MMMKAGLPAVRASLTEAPIAWNQNRVGQRRRFRCDTVRVGGGVQDSKRGFLLPCLRQQSAEAGRLGGYNGRDGLAAMIGPQGGAGLGVQIENHRGQAKGFGGYGKMDGNCGFASSSFSAHDR